MCFPPLLHQYPYFFFIPIIIISVYLSSKFFVSTFPFLSIFLVSFLIFLVIPSLVFFFFSWVFVWHSSIINKNPRKIKDFCPAKVPFLNCFYALKKILRGMVANNLHH